MTRTAARSETLSEALGGSRNGFIMVAALWLLAALATLASVASLYMVQSARGLTVFDTVLQSEMLTRAGLELAAYQLAAPQAAPPAVQRPTHGGFSFKLANSVVSVQYVSEAARINLNMAPKAMIVGLFTALGAKPEEADQFADRVIGWRSKPKPNAEDEEEALYRAAGLNYLPRRASFNSVDELWLVLGLPPEIVERALPFVTVYSGMAEINALDAAPEVIAALPDMTPARLAEFLSQRDTLPPDQALVVAALGGGNQLGVTVKGGDAYRVRMRITFPDGQRRTPEGVITISGSDAKEAFAVLAWQDEIDLTTGGPPRPAVNR
jgi:general secretion pathway protein K